MKWNDTTEGEALVTHLTDTKYGDLGYIREQRRAVNPKQWSWEVEFSAGDLDLYWNEIYTGTLEQAKLRLLELAQTYLGSKVDELNLLREKLKQEMQVIKS